MTRRVSTVAVTALLSVIVLSSCSLQAKKEQTALIVDAADATLRLPPYNAVLTSSIRPHDINGRNLSQLLGNRARSIPPIRLPMANVALALKIRRAVVLPSPEASGALGDRPVAPQPGGNPLAGFTAISSLIDSSRSRIPLAVAFSRWDIFVRPNVGAIAEGAGIQGGGGTWLWLDVSALDPDLTTSLVAPTPVLMLPPHVLVLLLKGALAGSVEQLKADEVGGVPTSHFRFNIDRDKAADDLDDKDVQRLEKLFEADNIDGTFYDDAEAWIDGDGVVRRFSVTVPQRIDALTSFDLTYRFELTGPRSDPLPMPTNDELAEVPTLPELLPGTAGS